MLEAYCDSVEKTRAKDQKRQASEHYKEIRRKSKVTQSTTGPSNDYGLNASHEDIDPNELHKLCEENSKRANLSPEEIIRMELQTRGQSNCPLWHQLRKQRLIASRFGEICKRRKSTPCARLVVEILHPRPISSESLRWGTENEKIALEEYCKESGNSVQQAGLFICSEHGYLAASPDGIVVLKGSPSRKGLVEVKCPYSATRKTGKAYTPMEAAKKIKNFPLEVKPNGQLALKKNHNHFYQVQGQLHITGYKWCDYVVWTPSGLHVERIEYDAAFWERKMFPNLKWFYFNCLLPETASPRHPQGLPIREPSTVTTEARKRKARDNGGTANNKRAKI